MGMSSASSVSLTSLSAAQGIPVRQIITWPLDIREADADVTHAVRSSSQASKEPLGSSPNELDWLVLQVRIQGKDLVCGWVCSLAV